MHAACTPVGFRMAMALSALHKNESTPSDANVARSGGGSIAAVDAVAVAICSVEASGAGCGRVEGRLGRRSSMLILLSFRLA